MSTKQINMKAILTLFMFLPCVIFSQHILFLGAKAHIGNGSSIDVSAISIKDGKIDMVADATGIRINPQAYDTIYHVYNHHIYPGFIATNTTLGITEISAVRATNDYRETGVFKPHVRSLIAFNAESVIIPTIRSNGVLLAQVAPKGGRICGTSSVMKLDGWNWEDAAQKVDDGIHLNWPSYFVQTGWWAEPGDIKKTDTYQENYQDLEAYFSKAQSYLNNSNRAIDISMQAMMGLFTGQKRLYIHADSQREIIDAVLFSKKMNIPHIAIVGARQAHLITSFLKTHDVPLLLDRIHRLPATEDSDVDMPYKQAKILADANLTFGFCYQGDMEAMGQRNLPFSAGTAVAHGLDYETAVSALTLNTAKILGIDHKVGTLSSGKEATFFVSKGDALDMMTNNVKYAYIQGVEVDLDNKQKVLNRKYRKKYGLGPKK